MAYRILQLYCNEEIKEQLCNVCDHDEVIECNVQKLDEDDSYYMQLLVRADQMQDISDEIMDILGDEPKKYAAIVSVEALLPTREEEEEQEKNEKKKFLGISREELSEKVQEGARRDINFILMVALSTIVAAIGLIENNVAVIVGAMVIAPLLGPNLALAFATALGDIKIMKDTLITNFIGFGLCLLVSIFIGFIWPYPFESSELTLRTTAGYDSILLAVASGAAAVLSLTRGISSAMVGVMVAVALLPPAVALGLMTGNAQWNAAYGAFLVLAANIIALNLSAKLTFMFSGIHPRKWYEEEIAKETRRWYLAFWTIALLALSVLIAFNKYEILSFFKDFVYR